MPTSSGKPSLMEAILSGEKPTNFLSSTPVTDWIGDGVESPIDGKFYRSKGAYLDHLKREGCHIVEESPERRAEKRRQKREKDQAEYKQALKETEEFSQGRII